MTLTSNKLKTADIYCSPLSGTITVNNFVAYDNLGRWPFRYLKHSNCTIVLPLKYLRLGKDLRPVGKYYDYTIRIIDSSWFHDSFRVSWRKQIILDLFQLGFRPRYGMDMFLVQGSLLRSFMSWLPPRWIITIYSTWGFIEEYPELPALAKCINYRIFLYIRCTLV